MIKRVEMFETLGKRFDTLQKAIDHREGLVDEFLRTCPGFADVPSKQRIAFVQHVLDNRDKLRGLLDFNSTASDEE